MKRLLLLIVLALAMPWATMGQAVVNLDAEATVNSVLVTWDYPNGYGIPADYEVSYGTIGGPAPVTVTTTVPYCTITGLLPFTDYYVAVRANWNAQGFGEYDTATFTTGPFYYRAMNTGNIHSHVLPFCVTDQSS